MLNYFEEENVVYQPFDKIKDQIMGLMDKALLREVTSISINLENEIPYYSVGGWVVYVVLLWGVCVLSGDGAYEKEKEKILDQLIFVLIFAGHSYLCVQ